MSESVISVISVLMLTCILCALSLLMILADICRLTPEDQKYALECGYDDALRECGIGGVK